MSQDQRIRTGAMVSFVFLSAGLMAQEDPCTLLPDPGDCEAAIPAWYFDAETETCTQFTWGGCGGVVPFETLEDCEGAGCSVGFDPGTLCDSISVTVILVGDAELGHLEVVMTSFFYTEYWFAYAGFSLFDMEGNLLAAENVETANNAYGFGGGGEYTETRYLEYEPGIDLSTWATPFEVELRLYEGWMAGGEDERCSWIWTSFGAPSGIEHALQESGSEEWSNYDLLGRPMIPESGELIIQRNGRGKTRKVISE
jgi:hypothetical protein